MHQALLAMPWVSVPCFALRRKGRYIVTSIVEHTFFSLMFPLLGPPHNRAKRPHQGGVQLSHFPSGCCQALFGNHRQPEGAAALRSAIDHLPRTRMATPATAASKGVLDSCEFPIACWPRRFMEEGMTAAVFFCQ
ncbi:unnamed protein product, partial [Pylaiella littoralis]